MTIRSPKALLIAAVLLMPLPTHGDALALPDLGASSERVLSPRDEAELGEAFMRRLRRETAVMNDPELAYYIGELGNRLVSAADPMPWPFTFFLVDHSAVNAFAAPGGYIGIHSGLFLAAESESELAAVLAHETAHVTQHHMARAYEAAGKMSLPMAAGMLAAILVGSQSPEAGQAALIALQAGSLQYQINFTRANEREADNIGMRILDDADFDPRGMPDFFRRLAQANRYSGNNMPAFLSTHPVTTDRIAEATARAGESRTSARDELSFRIAQARLRVLTARDLRATLAWFRPLAEDSVTRDPAARYGYALALANNRDYEQARRLLQALVRENAHPWFHLGLAQVELAADNTALTVELLDRAADLYPVSSLLPRYRAEALLRAGQAKRAWSVMDRYVRKGAGGHDPEAWHLLARTAQASDRGVDSHRAMAEHLYLRGQIHDAMHQLELALKIPGLDFYQSTRIEARLAEIRLEAKEESRSEAARPGNLGRME